MSESARVTFYKVVQCGYYKRSHARPEFGELPVILEDLTAWVKKDARPLNQTCTFRINDATTTLGTYLFDIRSADGDYLITTWNETPASEGSLHAVPGDKPVGKANVVAFSLPDGTIPGYATYFWFVPEKQVFATVRFQHSLNGHSALVKYVEEFVKSHSRFAQTVHSDENQEMVVVGYRDGSSGPIMDNLHPRFDTIMFRRPGAVELLRKNRENIRKIIRKTRLDLSVPDNETWLNLSLKLFRMGHSSRVVEPLKIKQELAYQPTKDQLDHVIAHWQAHQDSKWDDVGFQFTNETTVHWMSHAFARTEVELDITWDNAEMVNVASLAAALKKNKSTLLRRLMETETRDT